MTGISATAVAVYLADGNSPKGPEFGKASPIGLAVIVILVAATFLLIRSMNRHVRNLPESFDEPTTGTGGNEHTGTPDHRSDKDRPGETWGGHGPDGDRRGPGQSS